MIRGREVSRVEGFSDAVFGFTLTLLVVSTAVPENFADLRRTIEGFPAFAATFAVICWIWCRALPVLPSLSARRHGHHLPE